MSPTEVHVQLDGPEDAPVLILSNSLGSTLRMWDPQVGSLTDRFRVVRYDIRGHGLSPVAPGPYSLADLGEDVIAMLDRLGLTTVSFCGLSLGGMVGLWLGAHAPDRLDRLVVCCTSAALGTPQDWIERAATVRASGTDVVADAVLERWFTPDFTRDNPDLVTRMRSMVVDTPDEGYAGCCEAIATMDIEEGLPSIAAPTLAIAAAEDPVTPPDHAKRIVAAIPGASLKVIDNAAHLANVEQPEIVTRVILDHLSKG